MAAEKNEHHLARQYSTFYVAGRLYGIDVMKVQEITRALPITEVPLSPVYVHGLINLRGQISTAVGLRELFMIDGRAPEDSMNVVCKIEDGLFSFVVDRIGDVMEVEPENFEPPPDTVPDGIRRYMGGVFKVSGDLMSVVDIEKMAAEIVASASEAAARQAR
jgi:purine-binding chemotaxis protein CheW